LAQEVPAGPSNVIAFDGVIAIDPGGTCGNYMCLIGGSGSFSFASEACAMWSDPVEVGLGCFLGGSGTYEQTACFTGSEEGSVSLAGDYVDVQNVEAPETGFWVTNFVDGFGVLTGVLPEADGEPPDSLTGVFVIALEPGTLGDPTQNQCINGFTSMAVIVGADLLVQAPIIPRLV
jgi:hypothetical protein